MTSDKFGAVRRLVVLLAEACGWIPDVDEQWVERFRRGALAAAADLASVTGARDTNSARVHARHSRIALGGVLAQVTGLEPYGESLLSPRASVYLRTCSFLVITLVLWESLAAVLATYVVMAEIFGEAPAAVLSVLCGMMIGSLTLLIQRSFLTSASARHIVFWIPRVVLSIGITFVLAAPLEMIIFAPDIQSRLSYERVQRGVLRSVRLYGKSTQQLTSVERTSLRMWIDTAIEKRVPFQPEASFLDKVRILDDIRDGRPAVPPGLTEPELKELASLRRLNVLPSPADVPTTEAGRLHWALLIMLFTVPMSSLLLRWLAPPELDFYLDTAAQLRYAGLSFREAMTVERHIANVNLAHAASTA